MAHTARILARRLRAPGLVLAVAILGLSDGAAAQSGPQPVRLGAADRFALLAGGTVTNTGPTAITGDLGAGLAVLGFPPGTVTGSTHAGDAAAQRAAADLAGAYDDLAGRPASATLPPDLGGRTLGRGVHRAGAAPVGLSGRLTLDAQGDQGAVFVLQVPSTLVTARGSSVRLVNGAQACNVFWQVSGAATLGTRSAFQGTLLAATAISAEDGAAVHGRLLSRGAVTSSNATVTRPACSTGTSPGAGSGGGTGTAPPPQDLRVRLSKPAVLGRLTSLVVETSDPRAPVSGISVQFGKRRNIFGNSACRPPDSRGSVPGAFRAGRRTRLAVPHRFRKRREQRVIVRVDSGGCGTPLTSVYQTVTVLPTRVGEPLRPLVADQPTREAPRGSPLPPILPGLPASGPGLPGLPDLGAALARRQRGCRGADRPLGRSRSSRRLARRALLCLLNQARREHGLRPLRSNPRLLRAAERHSRSMVTLGFFSHVDPLGLSSLERIRRTGYLRHARAWSCGENIGYGEGPTSSPRSMMQSWMNSAPHRANILTAAFREVGLGGVPGIPGRAAAGGGTYTTVFGFRG